MRTQMLSALFFSLVVSACQRGSSTTTPPARDGGRMPCHCRHDAAMPINAPLPDTSVYQIDTAWTDQAGRSFRLSSLRGAPTVMLLFYGTCTSVCPILISDLLRLEAALAPEARAHTRFVLVTLDPATDTPERLRALAEERHMDLSRWTLLHGSDDDVRTIATAIGVQYSRVAPGTITHSNVLTLLDPQGVVRQQLEGLRQPVEPMARTIEQIANETAAIPRS